MQFTLPKGMLLGVASAATQIEGGNVKHSWNQWADQGHIHDGSSPRRANDHYNRWQEDIDLMASMGMQTYRFGIEWARLQPQKNKYNKQAAAHYRRMIIYMKSKGLQPLLTLHHFSNPLWFEMLGGFEKQENAEYFLSFVDHAIHSFGDLISEYITINEPNVYATQGYFGGGFPPGKNSMSKAIHVMSVLAGCHIQAYQLIHALRTDMGYSDTKVGFAHHMRVFAPLQKANPWHRLCAKAVDWMFQGMITKACLRGQFRLPIRNLYHLSFGEYADFLALNYYTRSSVRGLADGMAQDVPVNDLGWEIYPQGLVECAQHMYDYLPKPIYVTENGTCDNADSFRALYIAQHLQVISESHLPFKRYYHWCFTDNFEWLEGESARFGLVYVNYETQQRILKKSGCFYADIQKEGGMTESLYQKYIHGKTYHY